MDKKKGRKFFFERKNQKTFSLGVRVDGEF
jgi:hypothetical protein